MSAIFKPLSAKDLLKPSGQVGIQLDGQDGITPFGHATLTWKKSSTKSEIRTPESPGREIVGTDYSEQAGMFEIQFSNMNKLGLALAFMAKLVPTKQDAVQSAPQTFRAIQLNQWLELKGKLDADGVGLPTDRGLLNTVVTAVTYGGAALTLNTHYRHDSKSGGVQVHTLPEDAEEGEDVVVTRSAPAIAPSSSRTTAQLLQELVVRGRLFLRQNNLRGVNRKIVIPIMSFGGDSGDVQLIQDGNDIVKVTATGTIEADFSQDEGFENGWIEDLI